MSQCFRTLPGRLSALVSGGGGRKPLSKLERLQLQKNVAESSAFLKQFLGTQRALSVRANTTGKSVPFVGCMFPANLPLVHLDVRNRSEKPARRHANDESKSATMYWVEDPRRLRKPQRLGVDLLRSNRHVASIGIAPDSVKLFQTQSVTENDKATSFLDNSRVISLESLRSSREINIYQNVLLTSDDTSALKTSSQQPSPRENEGKPSQEQLQSIVDCLSQDLPKLFIKPQNFSIYTQDLIFVNNIRGVTTTGLMNYVKQLMLLRFVGHIKFAYVKLDILKITIHHENDTVQVRWRIQGITGWRVLTMFWKYKIWKIKDAINTNQAAWYDGFSTFYVNADGKIYKHIADKMMPDQDTATKKEDLRMAPKLALFTGLANVFGNNQDSLN
ncbi:PREDICTED: uncharacterized protein LOC105564200 [Vollenhovia emeryi]|uniref:uncharacterized protein LOC105564200 n=1 Tax=Vollenhovia emeryi TaxID=411798 RepID=UPI0005F394B5|nr:PREDICTED: uncharacterized protein LOC105564200 [Vollenhovia emeryi]